jgi:hypothetical protein
MMILLYDGFFPTQDGAGYFFCLNVLQYLKVGCLHPVARVLGQVQGFRLTQHWFKYFI